MRSAFRVREWFARNRKRCGTWLVLLVLGFVYLLLVEFTPFRLICVFQRLTGLACPGCGISHFFIDLAHFRFADAVRENLAVAVLAPFWAVVLCIRAVWNPACLRKQGVLYNVFTWGTLALVLVFGVLRNLPGFEFLLPLYLQ